ncbi:MAG: GDSL-type esterase/lipase family protein [Sulfuricurvum sp.]|uniref:GDSL-type esterase/lipase family protein n=1 Tax=Sulfuricurvum sp. TaxID=2025608 RepID=UPI00356B2723
MRRLIFVLIILTIAMILFKTITTPKKHLPYFRPDERILAFGDSLTFGYGAARSESYPDNLQRTLKRRVINDGIPGELSEQGLIRLRTSISRYRPRLLLLCHGGNDILHNIDDRRLRYNLEQMIIYAHAHGVDVILIGVPKFSLLHLSEHPVYVELAKQYNLPIEGDILSTILHDNRYKSDYVHPNKAGYVIMAAAVEKVVREKYRFEE